MGDFFMLNNIEDVMMYASIAHKDQKMMEPEVPYLTHVFGVFLNVVEAYYNGNEKFDLDYALKVAILHDTIEDTSLTYENIKEKYGKDIADGVLALSKNKKIKKEDQIIDSIERIKKCRIEVQIVKMADRTYNMRCRPSLWNEQRCLNYINEAKYILKELGESSKYLKEKLSKNISNYMLKESSL